MAVSTVARSTPARCATLAEAIFYRGAGFATVCPRFVALGAIGAILFGYALACFRSSIGSMA